MNKKQPVMALATALVLAVFTFSAQAELKIQNASYNSGTQNVHVKGKLSGTSAKGVMVYDARTYQYLGYADTYSRNTQFKMDLFVAMERQVPCSVRVIAIGTDGVRRRGRIYDVASVNNTPDHCSQGR